jgi:putative oxidoreductase
MKPGAVYEPVRSFLATMEASPMDTLLKHTLAPLVLRVALGVVFIHHGLGKVNPDAEWGLGWNPSLPKYQQLLVSWGELIGGIAMIFGFLTRLAAVGLGIIMVGAIITVHGPNGFLLFPKSPMTPMEAGFEYNFVLLAICAAVVLIGPGTLAIDHFMAMRRKQSS